MSTESIRPAAEERTVSGVTGPWMLRTPAEPLGRYVGLHGVGTDGSIAKERVATRDDSRHGAPGFAKAEGETNLSFRGFDSRSARRDSSDWSSGSALGSSWIYIWGRR